MASDGYNDSRRPRPEPKDPDVRGQTFENENETSRKTGHRSLVPIHAEGESTTGTTEGRPGSSVCDGVSVTGGQPGTNLEVEWKMV